MIEINLVAIVIAVLGQFILGALWYSPLMFGKWWMEIMEVTHISKEELQKIQKKMLPFYFLQMLITIPFTYILGQILIGVAQPYYAAFLLWACVISPVQISSVIWGKTKQKFWAKQIFVMMSYQLVGIMLATYILVRVIF